MPPAKKAGAAAPKKGQKTRRREKKNIPHGAAHIKSTFNNTIVTITDPQGNVIAWAASGHVGFKGSRKSTPFAAQPAAENAARKAQEQGVKKVDVFVKGPGSGRETAIRSLQAAGLEGGAIADVTPQPHNRRRPTHHPEITPAAHRPHRRRPGVREAPLPARPARPRADQGKRIPAADAGEAEGPLHLRRHGEAVPPLLRRGCGPSRQDRRRAAADPGKPAGQRHLPCRNCAYPPDG